MHTVGPPLQSGPLETSRRVVLHVGCFPLGLVQVKVTLRVILESEAKEGLPVFFPE